MNNSEKPKLFIPTVRYELLIKANEKVTEDHGVYEKPDIHVSVVSGLDGDCSYEETFAVSSRLIALAKLISQNRDTPWRLETGEEFDLVNEVLFKAAARTPLQIREMVRDMGFEKDAFLKMALEEVEAEGSA